MRSGDTLRRDVLRMAQNAIYNAEKAKRTPLTEAEVLGLVTREVKTRRESVEAFRGGGREDLATKEEAEIAILGEYLPAGLTEAELASSWTRPSRRPARPRPGIWARSWAGSARAPGIGPTARSCQWLGRAGARAVDLAPTTSSTPDHARPASRADRHRVHPS